MYLFYKFILFGKGKLPEREGRKATGLKPTGILFIQRIWPGRLSCRDLVQAKPFSVWLGFIIYIQG